MKFNTIFAVVSFLVSSLLAYAFYIYSSGVNRALFTIGSFLFLLISCLGVLSVSFNQTRTTSNIKGISGIFFVVGLLVNFLFVSFNVSQSAYIVSIGLLISIYFTISYSIAKQNL